MRWSILLAVFAMSLAARTAHADDPQYKCAPPPGPISVTFKRDSAVVDLATWIMAITCKNVVFAADVPKHVTKVTVMAPNKMTLAQAQQLFVDALEATGLTVTVKPDTFVINLGPKLPRGCPDGAPPVAAAPPPVPDPDELFVLVDASIVRVDDTHYTVKKDLLGKLAKYEAQLERQARFIPSIRNGTPDGLKLYAIRPSSLLSKTGFNNGDTVQAVTIDAGARNVIETAEHAVAAYHKAKAAKKSIVVDIVRRGNPMTIAIAVQ